MRYSIVSALSARQQRSFVRAFYAIPNEVTDIQDPVSRHYAMLRLSVSERIGLIVLISPGSLLRLAQQGMNIARR